MGQIHTRSENIALVAGCYDELMTKESYDITSADIELTTPALLKTKLSASGNIKVTLAGGTDIVLAAEDVNQQEIYVKKVFLTGTTIGNDFYLWV